MRRITLADRLRYWFDNTISRGTVALIGWLFALVAALVLTSSLLVSFFFLHIRLRAGSRLLLQERLGLLE